MYVVLRLLCGAIKSCSGPLQGQLDEFLGIKRMKMFLQNIRNVFTNFQGFQGNITWSHQQLSLRNVIIFVPHSFTAIEFGHKTCMTIAVCNGFCR